MSDDDYSFDIDALRPETLSMARLSVYIGKLADLLGSKERVHFDRVAPGSAQLRHWIDPPAEEGVLRRIQRAADPAAPKDVRKAFRELDELLLEDGASAILRSSSGAMIIPFPGIKREKPIVYPSIRQIGTVEGQIVSVGGKDRSAHVIVEDEAGVTSSGLKVKRRLARELGKHLYGARIRFSGEGRWSRSPEGVWVLEDFTIERFEVLDEAPLSSVVQDLQDIVENAGEAWPTYEVVQRLREDDEAA